MRFNDVRRLGQLACALLISAVLAVDANAFEISVSDTTPRGCKLWKRAVILSGGIVEGDYTRLLAWLRANREAVVETQLPFVLDSPGGSVKEALRIASLFEDLLLQAWMTPACKGVSYEESTLRRPKCVGACFVLLVAAPTRTLHPPSVGLHRPTFDPRSYEKLDPVSARKAYEDALADLVSWLRRRAVPQHLTDAMVARSSQEVYWLTSEDGDALGDSAPWHEEYAIARCGFKKGLLLKSMQAVYAKDDALASQLNRQIERQSSCYQALLATHRSEWYQRAPER